ncbi:MAG: hypothetical protein RQ867_04225 [Mariprofundaceae bacterium]|nr:hypothetical protein [Mariprofundaceae bacterium]
MIRSILVAALFFFGPALLMFMLRNMFFLFRAWLRLRKLKKMQEHEVIDITPHKHGSPSMLFNIAAIVVGLICAFLAWQEMGSGPEQRMHYVPAHVDEQGKIVPGAMVPVEEATSSAPGQSAVK